MTTYEYKCRDCGGFAYDEIRWTKEQLEAMFSCACGGDNGFRRVFGFSYIKPMQAGYNPSVGKHISNMAQLKSEFSRMSDEAEMVTGNPHNFQPIDPMDKKALGVTDEGLSSTHDHLISEGKTQEAKRLLKP